MPRRSRVRAAAVFARGALTAVIAALLLAPTAAGAIDCRKAASGLERMICADAALRKADAALGSAYGGLLRGTDDSEIRAMLIASQKRWVAARDTWLGGQDAADDPPDPDLARRIVLAAIRARTQNLSRRATSDPTRPHWIAAALRQRAFAARFTGGPFAGFDTECYFLPVGQERVYGCFGSRQFQNGDRVCTLSDDWATGHVTETRTVGRVVDGAVRTVATCSIGGSGEADCPGPDSPTGRWTRPAAAAAPGGKAAPAGNTAPAGHRAVLDVELASDDDAETWLSTCLTDPGYPPPDPVPAARTGPGSGPAAREGAPSSK